MHDPKIYVCSEFPTVEVCEREREIKSAPKKKRERERKERERERRERRVERRACEKACGMVQVWDKGKSRTFGLHIHIAKKWSLIGVWPVVDVTRKESRSFVWLEPSYSRGFRSDTWRSY